LSKIKNKTNFVFNSLFVCNNPENNTINCYNMKKWEKHKRNTCFFCFHPLVSPLNGKVWLRVEEVGIRWDGV
jgi:hypothetical protein